MSSSVHPAWLKRKTKLRSLLGCNGGDDEAEGAMLDRLLLGRNSEGSGISQRAKQVEELRFSDRDLRSYGPLADAQFATVELVSCRLDNRVYVRKRIAKSFALRMRQQMNPQTERQLLLLSLNSSAGSTLENGIKETEGCWTPRMLCAYQSPTHLNIVMEYAEGGSLWDVLESAPLGRLTDMDLRWWAPQCVAAIAWCHAQGFAHRDIKPHNFVLRSPGARLLLIDFGSAAPLGEPANDGSQKLAREHCLVPCGTCDYISPEILQAHENALVELEFSDEEKHDDSDNDEMAGTCPAKEGIVEYGRETDWWSLGAMLYELAYGVAPFFAKDIRQTYIRIVRHETSLRFNAKIPVSPQLVSLIKELLKHHESRLGRCSDEEVKGHLYFKAVPWRKLQDCEAPLDLILPQFTYTTPLMPPEDNADDALELNSDASRPFAFSALFQSSVMSPSLPSPGILHNQSASAFFTPKFGRKHLGQANSNGNAHSELTSFIGFSWGPPMDAFDEQGRSVPAELSTSIPILGLFPNTIAHSLITPKRPVRNNVIDIHSTASAINGKDTRDAGISLLPPPSTVRRVMSVRRTSISRPISEREAMRVLVDCVGMSARKRVLESGKKPKVLLPPFELATSAGANIGVPLWDDEKKDEGMIGQGDGIVSGESQMRQRAYSRPHLLARSSDLLTAIRKDLRFDENTTQTSNSDNTFSTHNTGSSHGSHRSGSGNGGVGLNGFQDRAGLSSHGRGYGSRNRNGLVVEVGESDTDDTEDGGPPSPSPSPRPGSALSVLSMTHRRSGIRRRSTTPTPSALANVVSGALHTRTMSEPSVVTGKKALPIGRTRTEQGTASTREGGNKERNEKERLGAVMMTAPAELGKARKRVRGLEEAEEDLLGGPVASATPGWGVVKRFPQQQSRKSSTIAQADSDAFAHRNRMGISTPHPSRVTKRDQQHGLRNRAADEQEPIFKKVDVVPAKRKERDLEQDWKEAEEKGAIGKMAAGRLTQLLLSSSDREYKMHMDVADKGLFDDEAVNKLNANGGRKNGGESVLQDMPRKQQQYGFLSDAPPLCFRAPSCEPNHNLNFASAPRSLTVTRNAAAFNNKLREAEKQFEQMMQRLEMVQIRVEAFVEQARFGHAIDQ